MLTSLLVTVSLSAAPPAAQALEKPEWALEVPRIDRVPDLLTFFTRAGEEAALLLPTTWLPELHPLFPLDFEDPAQLQSAGVAKSSALVVSEAKLKRMTCLQVESLPKYAERADAQLTLQGEVSRQKIGAIQTVSAKREGKVVAAYAVKGKTVCSILSGRGHEATVKDAVAAVGRPAPAASKQGPARLWLPTGSGYLKGDAKSLHAQGEQHTRAIPKLATSTPGALDEHVPSGLLFVRGRVDPEDLMTFFEPNLIQLCSACPPHAVKKLLAVLAQEMSGEFIWRIDGLNPNPDFSTQASRIRSIRYAVGFGLANSEGAPGRFAEALTQSGASGQATEWEVPLDGRGVSIRFEGSTVWLFTDKKALERLRKSPASSGQLDGATYARLDAKEAGKALSRISILDLLRRPELASLVAVSAEVGPLLEASRSLEWHLEPDGQFSFDWQLGL